MTGRRQPRDTPLDRNAAELLYRQAIGWIARRIEAEQLRAGDRAPSVRALSRQLGVTHVTAWRALKTLADDGVLVVRRGAGFLVAPDARERLSDAAPPPPAASVPTATALAAHVVPESAAAAEIARRNARTRNGATSRDVFRGFSRGLDAPLHAQVYRCVADAIAGGRLRRGDRLPSLVEAARLLGLSVTTVAHGYRELQRSGIVSATFPKGYYVSTDTVSDRLRVFLMFDEFNAFKEDLFNALRTGLGDGAQVELFFHHYRRDVFEDLLRHAWGRYHFYVLIPHPDREAHAALDRFDPREVLLIDQRHGADPKFSIICQDFEGDTYRGLTSARDAIGTYDEFVLLDPEPESVHHLGPFADEIRRGFLRFCRKTGMPTRVVRGVQADHLRPGVACLAIGEEDLVALVQTVAAARLRVGKDVGVIAYNESLLKQVIAGGISTLSTDFARMGREAARHILERRARTDEVNPSALTVRASLRREGA